jgi:hypothetical protein
MNDLRPVLVSLVALQRHLDGYEYRIIHAPEANGIDVP